MTTPPHAALTDEAIDGLEGFELDEAVCLALGWKWVKMRPPGIGPELADPEHIDGRPEVKRPKPGTLIAVAAKWGMAMNHRYHKKLGAAMSLLLMLDYGMWSIAPGGLTGETNSEIYVLEHFADGREKILCYGPKDHAATLLCRAYLKLRNRS